MFRKDSMTTKERIQWYTSFIQEASKLGVLDRSVLIRKRGVVEMLRKEVHAEPDEAAYAYMVLQKREKKGGRTTNPSLATQVVDQDEVQDAIIAYDIWFEIYYSALGTDVYQELKQIIRDTVLACYGTGQVEETTAILIHGINRVVAIAEQALNDRDEVMSNAACEISGFLEELARVYESRLLCSYLDDLVPSN